MLPSWIMAFERLENTLPHLAELALGGTAVGTGFNTPKGYSKRVAEFIAKFTDMPFTSAGNKFEALAAHDALCGNSWSIKTTGRFSE